MPDDDEAPRAFRVAVRLDQDPDDDLDVRAQIFKDGRLQEVALEDLPDEVLAAIQALFEQLSETEH